MESNKRVLGWKELFYLSLGGFGLQFAGALEMSNTSGLFKFLGATDKQVSWLWLIAPVTGLIIQPVLGQLSDLIDTRHGKRAPFIFGGGVFAFLSLIFLTFSESLTFTAIMILVLSCSINASTEGLRALIGDITPNSQKSSAFAWQAILGGIGAMIASLIPWLFDLTHIFAKPDGTSIRVPIVIKVSLFVGGIVLAQTIWSMLREIREENYRELSLEAKSNQVRNYFVLFVSIWQELFHNVINMPSVIKKFFLVQIFTWAGVFCVWLYFGIALAQHIYDLPADPALVTTLEYQTILRKGILEAGICFAIYQLFGMLFALVLPKLSNMLSPYKLHAYSLFAGAFSLLLVVLFNNIWLTYFAMAGLGIFWGSVSVMPYAIVAAELPTDKTGTYFGVFNITITIPQIICGVTIGFINEYLFLNHAIFTILLAGIFMGIAGIILLRQEGVDIIKIFYLWFNKVIRKSLPEDKVNKPKET